MKILSASQTQQADAFTIEHEPIASIDLMERAAKQLLDWFTMRFDNHTAFEIFVGPGNNGGDALVLARLLWEHEYKNLRVYLVNFKGSFTPDNRLNQQRLTQQTPIPISEISSSTEFPQLHPHAWVVDGLFGSGLTRVLEGGFAALVEHMNRSPKKGVVAIDIPSGLFAEPSDKDNCVIVKADFTLTFHQPKLSFMFADFSDWVGEFFILPIGLDAGFISKLASQYNYVTFEFLERHLIHRPKFSHKGTFGHTLVIAGSYGMVGAAMLAVRAALRTGAGLVTAHVPRLAYNMLQTSIPEAIYSIDESEHFFTSIHSLEKYQSIAIGPGLNTKKNTQKALGNLLHSVTVPLVIDADALNIIAENPQMLDVLPKGCIITPHPKEFDRLFGQHSSGFARCTRQIELSEKYQIIILLKGAHTSISLPNGSVFFNSTGNAGMATGGAGDVLTGIVAGLLAQGYAPDMAALMAAYLHGLAGDFAMENFGKSALIASDIIDYLGAAFKTFEKTSSHV